MTYFPIFLPLLTVDQPPEAEVVITLEFSYIGPTTEQQDEVIWQPTMLFTEE